MTFGRERGVFLHQSKNLGGRLDDQKFGMRKPPGQLGYVVAKAQAQNDQQAFSVEVKAFDSPTGLLFRIVQAVKGLLRTLFGSNLQGQAPFLCLDKGQGYGSLFRHFKLRPVLTHVLCCLRHYVPVANNPFWFSVPPISNAA